ncbi:MAG: FG-GAP repeat protein [Chloroflexi bacterium]|nr:FG-GAP repeat protein [Chloroflexota bacterium]
MKALQYPLAIACLAALLLVLTTALPTPTAHATASVPVGLSPAEWTQIQSQLPSYAITTWSQQAKLTASDAAAEDRFGNSVAVAGIQPS